MRKVRPGAAGPALSAQPTATKPASRNAPRIRYPAVCVGALTPFRRIELTAATTTSTLVTT
ncbi:MAG TPA: hypothetical protein VH113_02605, partial [Gemmatimonadales bacterium]|nr:hypothetical protein [Gemmatimonadales bacterium]